MKPIVITLITLFFLLGCSSEEPTQETGVAPSMTEIPQPDVAVSDQPPRIPVLEE